MAQSIDVLEKTLEFLRNRQAILTEELKDAKELENEVSEIVNLEWVKIVNEDVDFVITKKSDINPRRRKMIDRLTRECFDGSCGYGDISIFAETKITHQIVAFAAVYFKDDENVSLQRPLIANVCSSPKMRRRGLITTMLPILMDAVVNYSKEAQMKLESKVEPHVEGFVMKVKIDNIPAINLYKKLGFIILSVQKIYDEDFYIMERFLGEIPSFYNPDDFCISAKGSAILRNLVDSFAEGRADKEEFYDDVLSTINKILNSREFKSNPIGILDSLKQGKVPEHLTITSKGLGSAVASFPERSSIVPLRDFSERLHSKSTLNLIADGIKIICTGLNV